MSNNLDFVAWEFKGLLKIWKDFMLKLSFILDLSTIGLSHQSVDSHEPVNYYNYIYMMP